MQGCWSGMADHQALNGMQWVCATPDVRTPSQQTQTLASAIQLQYETLAKVLGRALQSQAKTYVPGPVRCLCNVH